MSYHQNLFIFKLNLQGTDIMVYLPFTCMPSKERSLMATFLFHQNNTVQNGSNENNVENVVNGLYNQSLSVPGLIIPNFSVCDIITYDITKRNFLSRLCRAFTIFW